MRAAPPAPYRLVTVLVCLLVALAAADAQATEPWPAESWDRAAVLTGLDSDFTNNLSGAYWNPETRTLWVCINGPGRFWGLIEDGRGSFTVAARGGAAAEFTIGGDIEGITQVDPLEPAVYVINEALGAVEKYDVSTYGAPTLLRRWDLGAQVGPAGGAGAEGITFVPDAWLARAGFVDGGGAPYVSRNGMGGLVLVAHQNGGRVYAFDLAPDSGAYDFVGAYLTSRGESSGLEFDESSGKLYVWHNTGSNYVEVSDLTSYVRGDGQRQLTTVREFVGPRSGNLEGLAVSPAAASEGWCFTTDDNNKDGAALLWFRDCRFPQLGLDHYVVAAGSTLVVQPPGVTANDTPAGAPALLIAEPAYGDLVGLRPGDVFDGAFVYVPAAGFAGTDVFTYMAADGDGESEEASVLIDVLGDGGAPERFAVDVRVAASADDAEERADGSMYLDSTDLELTEESSQQTVGIRFAAVDVPARARVVAAWLQFTVDEPASGSTTLTIHGEATAAAAGFSSAPNDIGARPLTAAAVPWNPPAWDVVGESGPAQRTPDLAPVVQEIVDGAGWAAGNPMAFVVTGTGKRTAESYDGSPASAAALHVLFEEPAEPACTAAACDDGDACTTDLCDPATGCSHGAVSCDDGDACTADACDPASGCVFTGVSCDDGDACTTDGCDPARGCVHSSVSCGDGDACTADSCDPAHGCVFAAISCGDGDACTADSCDPAHGCVFAAISCDDGDACTTDACDPAHGCVFAAISCDDGDACTTDACDPATGCVHTAVACDDGDPCTDDVCDPATGCAFPFNTAPCDDGDACTAGDRCDGAGACRGVDVCAAPPQVWSGVTETTAGWTYVSFQRALRDPVVVCTPSYDSGSAPLVSRVVPAPDGRGFDLAATRVGVDGGFAAGVAVHCLAVEAGVYTEGENGVTMEAVSYVSTVVDNNGSWAGEERAYRNAYDQPVVVGQVMSYADPSWSVFWSRGGSQGSAPDGTLRVGRHVGEDPDRARAAEVVGYIVIEAGAGTLGGAAYVADLGPETIRGTGNTPPYSYALDGLADATLAVASVAGMNGGNGGWAHLYGAAPVSAAGLDLAIDEDQQKDGERSHIPETVGYIAFEGPAWLPPAPVSVAVRVSASTDDAEERGDGSMYLNSTDLELTEESSVQTVGVRFAAVPVPPEAAIVSASIQFTVDEADSRATDLVIEGEASPAAATWGTGARDISRRARTKADVRWTPAPWPTVGAAGADQRTPDLGAVVQEIVDQPGWAAGAPMAFVVTGSGKRIAESWNGSSSAAPLLRIVYQDLSDAPAGWAIRRPLTSVITREGKTAGPGRLGAAPTPLSRRPVERSLFLGGGAAAASRAATRAILGVRPTVRR